MFSERFDALMKIAEVSNSLLGRDIHMNPSHIGRLRSGARSLAKKHDYLPAICLCLANHIQKDYQVNALQKLTGIPADTLTAPKAAAEYLERWLLAQAPDSSAAASLLITGFSRVNPGRHAPAGRSEPEEALPGYETCLLGNAGKRQAVIQFFHAILQEAQPQTLLLFSDENMAWLYEDAAFAAQWAALFARVIARGNRVRMIHTVSRDINEMLEAITKWIPLYMTGRIEPYFYPRLRDGLYQRTLFIAPKTAAVVSASVQQNTEGMLNQFLTDPAALGALVTEYERLFAYCRPLMKIFTAGEAADLAQSVKALAEVEGDAFLCSALPPFFTLSPELIAELTAREDGEAAAQALRQGSEFFRSHLQNHRLTLTLLNPEIAMLTTERFRLPMAEAFLAGAVECTPEQYRRQVEWLQALSRECPNLTLNFSARITGDTVVYVKEEAGVILTKNDFPPISFVISERNMVASFWDCIEKRILF